MWNSLKGVSLVVALGVLAVPGVSLAGSSWSAVTVNQSQSVASPHHAVSLKQSADVQVSTWLDGQAVANSHVKGQQSEWFKGKGSQAQEINAGVALEWQDSEWPSTTTAHAVGSLDQAQKAWSSKPIKQNQSGGVWLDTKVDSNHSESETKISQSSKGAIGHSKQDQSISGESHSEGLITWPWKSHGSSHGFGGKLVQEVTVIVRNILDF